MAQVKPKIEAFARIKVVGIGGSGLNAVNHMIKSKISGVDFIAINTDAQDLHHCLSPKRIHIGKNLTKGLGAGMNPEIGRQAAEETKSEIQDSIKGADMVFVTCGLGGGTGTGGAPVIAKYSREQGALTIAVITLPFGFEGIQRAKIAEDGLLELKNSVDAMIVIPNDRLITLSNKETGFLTAFAMSDDVLRQAVQGISDLITMPGIINVDFADVKAILKEAGSALMGIGYSQGEKRAEEAARTAINSPLLNVSIDGAKGVLFAISGGPDMTMWEIQEAAKVITESIDSNAKVIFGAFHDQRLKKNEFKVTVIASGFSENSIAKSLNSQNNFSANPEFPEKNKNNNNNTDDASQENSEETWDAVPAFLRRSKKI